MSLEDLKEELTKAVEPSAIRQRDHGKCGCLLEVRARPDQIQGVARAARYADCFLESVTAAHYTDELQVIYHFNSFGACARLQVRVALAGEQAVPTVSTYYDAALWHEREVFDLFGVRFEGHPDLRRLLLPEDADFHPLRKDFGKVHAFRSTEEIYGEPDA